MCFFSRQSKDALTLEKRYRAKMENPEQFRVGDFNAFAHPLVPIISNEKEDLLQFSQWGLIPYWAKNSEIQKSTLNARLETIKEKPSFRNSLSKRCIIPSDGFYEWQWLDPKGKQKQKYLLHFPDDALFSLAGLWNIWTDPITGTNIHTFTILTTAANQLMSVIHNTKKRMPIIIHPDSEKDWLQQGSIKLYNDALIADVLV